MRLQDENKIRFFDRKTCYSVHGDHAYMIAQRLYRSTAQVTMPGERSGKEGLPTITLSSNLFPSLCKELLVEQGEYEIEVYEGSGSSWKCTKRGSPGRWRDFEAEIGRAGDVAESPVVAAVVVESVDNIRRVGMAFVNMANRCMGACEFADDEHFSHLETALVQLGAKEAVLPTGSMPRSSIDEDLGPEADADASHPPNSKTSPNRKITAADRSRLSDALVSRCRIMTSERPRSTFSTKLLRDDLGRMLRSGSSALESFRPILDLALASSALAGCLAFSELLSDDGEHGRWNLELYSTGRFMRVDASAQRALNVFPSRTDAADTFSLYGLLNRCRTAMGKRLLRTWLKQPLVDPAEIVDRHDIVEAFHDDASLRSDVSGLHLRGLPDIDRLKKKLEDRTATLQDLCQLYRASSRLPMIEGALREHRGRYREKMWMGFADPLAAAHDAEHLSKFEDLIEAALDLDKVPDEYLISSTYDEQLEEIEGEKRTTEEEIERLAENAAQDLGLVLGKSVKLEWHKTTNQRIRCLRITAKEERTVRKKLQSKYLELETRKDGVKFTNRRMKAVAERLQRLSGDYEKRQATLVQQVVAVAATFSEVWEQVSQLLAQLDVLSSFAEAAAMAPRPYVRPSMLPPSEGRLVLKACRHPCVEAQDGVEFIPNDVEMIRGDSWFQLITGPNMGGKSTFIRQIGVCVLMAQIGSFVPADEAEISTRDAIFARVGAGDCQMRGVSTFMAEMLEAASIVNGASSSSLVIIDELGRGTSTWDGMGLAWAMSEYLMEKIGAATLFATHFHELTALKGSVGVRNLHVSSAIDGAAGGLTMLYQVKEGTCSESLGIHVAEFARFPQKVIDAAKERLAKARTPTEEIEDTVGRKRKGCGTAALREALLEFCNVSFESMDEESVVAEAGKWADRLESCLGPEAVRSRTA